MGVKENVRPAAVNVDVKEATLFLDVVEVEVRQIVLYVGKAEVEVRQIVVGVVHGTALPQDTFSTQVPTVALTVPAVDSLEENGVSGSLGGPVTRGGVILEIVP